MCLHMKLPYRQTFHHRFWYGLISPSLTSHIIGHRMLTIVTAEIIFGAVATNKSQHEWHDTEAAKGCWLIAPAINCVYKDKKDENVSHCKSIRPNKYLSIYLVVYSLHRNVLPTLQSVPLMTNGPLYPITQDSSCHGQHTMPRNPWSFPTTSSA